jgi:hypothetical protein
MAAVAESAFDDADELGAFLQDSKDITKDAVFFNIWS